MSTSGDVVTRPATPANSHSPGTQGTKRCRDVDLDASSSEPAWVHNLEGQIVDEEEFWQEQTQNHTPVPNITYEVTIPSPQSKRRVFASSTLPDDYEPYLRAWSQDPLFTFSEYSQGESTLKELNDSTAKDIRHSESQVFSGFPSEAAWGAHLDVAATTSTQKSLKRNNSTLLDDDKENAKFGLFKSPNPKRPRSPPKYIPVHPLKAHKEESQLTCTKPRGSAGRRTQPSCKADEDSLAALFTQDSEGFMVIAHGGTRGPSPLEDHSNVDPEMSRIGARRFLPEEEEEMLFTQDSQGNVVIKH